MTSGALLDPGAPLESEVQAMEESGVTTLRAPFYWWTAQPDKGQPPNFEATDPLVEATARAGIELLPIVVGTPSWAARHPKLRNSPPAGTATYAAFLKALIGRYGPDGSFWSDHPDVPKQPIEAWQIWNEPDHLHYWSDQPYARDYVALARAARARDQGGGPGRDGRDGRLRRPLVGLDRGGLPGRRARASSTSSRSTPTPTRCATCCASCSTRAARCARPATATGRCGSPRSPGRRASAPGTRRRRSRRRPTDQAARLAEALPLLIRERQKLGVERIFWENWISTDSNHANPFDFSGLRVLNPDGSVTEKPAFAEFKRIALAQP